MKKPSPSTPKSEAVAALERAVLKAALLRFHAWRKAERKAFVAQVLGGDDSKLMGAKLAGEMIRACHALDQARKA